MRPRIAWVVLLPAAGFLSGGVLSQHVRPLVFGLPFLLLWNAFWVLATSAALGLVYHLDPDNHGDEA